MLFGKLLIFRALLFGFSDASVEPGTEENRRRCRARPGLNRQALNLGQRGIPGEPSQFALHASFSFGAAEHDLIARRRGDSFKLGLSLHIGFVRMERAAAEQRAGCGGGCLCGPITAAKTSAGD